MKNAWVIALISVLASTSVFAHGGVKNMAVMSRMENMVGISQNVKLIAEMSKGTAAFDATAVEASLKAIQSQAGQIPSFFMEKATDPKSEALDTIWETWDDFSQKATDLEIVAQELSGQVSADLDLTTVLRELGQTCKACHAKYRR